MPASWRRWLRSWWPQVQVVVVVGVRVQQDAREFPEIIQALGVIDDGVEAQPAVPDFLDQFAAGVSNGEVDVEGWTVRIG
jgi:hypothetical protein